MARTLPEAPKHGRPVAWHLQRFTTSSAACRREPFTTREVMDTSAIKLPTWLFFRRQSVWSKLCPFPKDAFHTSRKELSRPAARRVDFHMGATPSGMLDSGRQGCASPDLLFPGAVVVSAPNEVKLT